MISYIPNTKDERQQMLSSIGCASMEDLLDHIPEEVRQQGPGPLQGCADEYALLCHARSLSQKNRAYPTVLRGAGAYRHFIPPVVRRLSSRGEFVTAYTPYQPEMSQGILQAIFEFQTMICELTGLEASNASVYDGATAAAESLLMFRERGRGKALVSSAINPGTLAVIRTYLTAADMDFALVPQKDGKTDMAALAEMLDDNTACVLTSQLSYTGQIEDAMEACRLAHDAGAKYIMDINPIAATVLASAGEMGADAAVGEGQPLGLPLSFGGPYLGFMATTTKNARKLPGRIVGQTTDTEGRRAFVLTLQAREQHIKRERAGSNICSNQALCALTASIYMGALGRQGLVEVAQSCYKNAHYFAQELCSIAGVTLRYTGDFFHEFVTQSDTDSNIILSALDAQGILGGLPLNERDILWCTTELNTKDELDKAIAIIKEAVK
ncbi:MAG: aminomethyl-transferring glycine dehydrogenase subunit GcvPA [Christensenellaceae bacterium]